MGRLTPPQKKKKNRFFFGGGGGGAGAGYFRQFLKFFDKNFFGTSFEYFSRPQKNFLMGNQK